MLYRLFNFRELRFSERFDEPVLTQTRLGQASQRKRKIRIARNGLLIPRDSLVERLRPQGSIRRTELGLAFQKQIIRCGVLGWRGGERASFGRGELRLKRIGDFLRYFALDRKDILDVAIVCLRP